MDRREFLRGAGAAAACAANVPAFAAARAAKPNILIIITDQQSSTAASYRMGTKYIHTPNMDSVAASGRIFTRAYCANPLCVPSRNSMFTGSYPTVNGIMDNEDVKTTRLDMRRFTIMGKIFESQGYQTAYFGKWHLAFPAYEVAVHGFSDIETAKVDTETAARSAEFLRRKHSEPFLMVASFMNPHNIAQWSRGQALPLGSIGQPPPPDQCPPLRADHAPQKNEPDIMALMRRSYQSAPMFPVSHYSDGKWRQYEWAYYRLIEKVDKQIGIVLQGLRDSGHAQDTLVVMLSDHGDCQGAHGWNQKTVFYEEAVRVPFVLSYPGMIPHGMERRLVNTGIDLIPTLCDYAGVRPPSGLPGLSLRKTPPDAANDPRKYVVASNKLIQGAPIDGRLPTPTGRMLRSQRYKYCVYNEGRRRESLVDLKTDPGEMVNLAGEPHYRPILNQHRAMLWEWCLQTQDSFPVPSACDPA